MEPLIKIGDKIVIQSVKLADLTSGDIILYKRNSSFCTHRYVCAIQQDQKIITKGDRLEVFDSPINCDLILGKVIAIYKQRRKIDLQQKKYIAINRLFGRLLLVQWHTIKTSQAFKKRFIIKNTNPVSRIPAKILVKLFQFLYKLLDYFQLQNLNK